MLRKRLFDLGRFDAHMPCALYVQGQLLEAEIGGPDEFRQDENRDLGRKQLRWHGPICHGLALLVGSRHILGKIDKGTSNFVPLQVPLPAQLNKDRMASTTQYFSQSLGSDSLWAAIDQPDKSVVEIAYPGKADVVRKPQAVVAEAGYAL